MDQNKMISILKEITYFILPSAFEPWGVVIHEMCAAGIPVICSDSCGARSSFVFDNYNGYVFKTNNKKSLLEKLNKSFYIENSDWQKFRKRSHQLSMTITPDLWASTVKSFI
jgi:glycosyltransferase involved in cell wall biosynthesis